MPYDLPRIPLPTTASSAELARLPAAIRQQALFSARLNLADPLAQIGADIKGILDGKKSLSESRRDIRAALSSAGYQPPVREDGKSLAGTLQDHTSRRRLDLILGQNVRAARGYGHRAASMDPDVLDMFPAQELVRVMARRVPRATWRERWRGAGGRLYEGRMIALKTDSVWTALSRFGLPYPPFDFGSGMGVVDIARAEAVRLGLMADDQQLEPDPVPFPATEEARLPDVSAIPALQDAIRALFPDSKFAAGVLTL
jgi:hypothetical protein